MSQTESAQYNAPGYQEDECCEEDGMRITVSNTYEMSLNRDDEQSPIFEGAVLRQLMKESDRAACRHDDEEDDTLMEYCNEEGGGPIGVDSDDE